MKRQFGGETQGSLDRTQDNEPVHKRSGMNRRSLLRGGALLAGGVTAGTLIAPLLGSTAAKAQAGRTYPRGRTPVAIKNNVYPRTYFPNTELLAADEMRIIALGTGMPALTPKQKSTGWLVELGNGDVFFFDVGSGTAENIAALRLDYAKLDKVFASHLHTDHIGDVPALWIGGWLGGRYTPLHIYGPSGAKKELGTGSYVDHLSKAYAWDVQGRSGILPDAGGKLIAHEFDYRKHQTVYNKNGVKITAWPAIHVIDGPVSYRLEWNGLSFVFGGDTYPNRWFIQYAQNVDFSIHECFLPPAALAKVFGWGLRQGTFVSAYIHTPPEAFGKIMSATKPRLAVAYHFWTHHDLVPAVLAGIRKTYSGPLTIANDLTVWNVKKNHIETREAVVDEAAWPPGTSRAYLTAKRSGEAKVSKFIEGGKWTGYKPPPLPKR